MDEQQRIHQTTQTITTPKHTTSHERRTTMYTELNLHLELTSQAMQEPGAIETILREIADKIEQGAKDNQGTPIRDTNGNTIGNITLDYDDTIEIEEQ